MTCRVVDLSFPPGRRPGDKCRTPSAAWNLDERCVLLCRERFRHEVSLVSACMSPCSTSAGVYSLSDGHHSSRRPHVEELFKLFRQRLKEITMLALRSVACQIEDLATPMEATGEMDSETPEPGHALATRLARWRTDASGSWAPRAADDVRTYPFFSFAAWDQSKVDAVRARTNCSTRGAPLECYTSADRYWWHPTVGHAPRLDQRRFCAAMHHQGVRRLLWAGDSIHLY